MNGRLLALVGAIALFAYVWSAAKPEAKRRVAAVPVRVARMSDPLRNTVRSDVPVPLIPAVEEVPAPALPEALWIGPPLMNTVPADLMPGHYRVVSNRGAVGELIVPGTVFGASPQELLVVPDGSVNWYFIRQAEPPNVREVPPWEAVRADIEELLPPPLDPRDASVPQPRPAERTFHEAEEPEGPPPTELTSKDRYLIEAQIRQWMRDRVRQAWQWLVPARQPPATLLAPRPRFLEYASHQRSAADPAWVDPPRRRTGTLTVSHEQPAEPTCACPVVSQ